MQVFFEVFSRTKKNHNAFHAILNKYIPVSLSFGRRTQLLQKLSGYTEEQEREYHVKAIEILMESLLAVMLLYSTIKQTLCSRLVQNFDQK